MILGCVRLGNPDLDFENLNPDFPIERTLRAHSLRHHKRTERKSPDITAVPSIKMFQNFFNQRIVKYSWLSLGLVRRRIIFPSKTALGYLLNLI